MTRVVYLVCSHSNPDQVLRLVKLLRKGSGTSRVVIHHDEAVSHLDPASLVGLDGVHLLEPMPIEWGTFSYVEMLLWCMRWALANLEFDWLVLLSGQDYPIQPVSQIERFLASTEYDGFVKGFAVSDPGSQDGEGFRRYYYRYHRVPVPGFLLPRRSSSEGVVTKVARNLRDAQPLLSVKRAFRSSGVQLGLRRLRTPFTEHFRCYRGSTWLTLSSKCVALLDRFVRGNPGYVRYYRRTWIPEESFIITILLNNPGLNLFRDHKRFIRFRAQGAWHPEVLTVEDLEPMLASGQHFARKFDARADERVLNLLDERVHMAPTVSSD
jgi:hypothetical protein